MYASPTDESDEEEEGREMMREERKLGVVHVWMEEGVIWCWMRGKCKDCYIRYLFLFNITQPFLQLGLTCQITFLFLFCRVWVC